jgi:quinol-cytochrome oxidoreductase complex cytochrome b subunit
MTLVIILLVLIAFYMFIKISQSTPSGDEKHKNKQTTK